MGYDKFRLRLGEQTFLACVGKKLLQNFQGPVICVTSSESIAAVETAAKDLPQNRLQIVADERGDSGPLEGIRVGLKTAQPFSEWAFVTSCDVPMIASSVLQLLQSIAGSVDDDTEAIVPASASRIFGMTALYRTASHPKIDSLIEQGQLRVTGLATQLETKIVDIDELKAIDPPLDSVRNLNSPEHYLRFLSEKGFACPPEIEQQLNLRTDETNHLTKTQND